MGEPIIAEYDEAWPARGAELRLRIAEVTAVLRGGEDFVVDHIGSTAVPGLAAKPIVDLQLLAPTLPDEQELSAALVPLGFDRARGSRPDSPGVDFDIPLPGTDPDPGKHAKLLFVTADADVILHVRRADSPFAAFVLAFRDWLRADAVNARRYEEAKRALAARFAGASDYDDYTRAKSSFLDDVQREMGFPA